MLLLGRNKTCLWRPCKFSKTRQGLEHVCLRHTTIFCLDFSQQQKQTACAPPWHLGLLTSHLNGVPAFKGMCVNSPPLLLTSTLVRPLGSVTTGTPAEAIARATMSFTARCLSYFAYYFLSSVVKIPWDWKYNFEQNTKKVFDRRREKTFCESKWSWIAEYKETGAKY